MRRCLELAAMGRYSVAPNPMVGCVIVEDDRIIAEGYHRQYGDAHAEIEAINQLSPGYDLSKASIYVSLEPCSHHGKTPPCVDQIILRKPSKVIVATKDPNPKVSGTGIERLLDAGIDVEIGTLADEAHILNKFFFTYHEKKRPYVTLKWARSNNGFIGKRDSQIWLTGDNAARLVHKWRAGHMSIMVGAKTVLTDQPRLNVRHWKGKDPIRVLLDAELDVPEDHSFYQAKVRTIVFNFREAKSDQNVEWIKINAELPVSPQVLEELAKQQIISLLVEGGAKTLDAFVQESCWDEAYELVAQKDIQGDIPAPNLHLESANKIQLGDDECITYKNPQPC